MEEKIREAADIQQALAVTELRNGNGRGSLNEEEGSKNKGKREAFRVAKIDELQFPSSVDEVKLVE